ncbi:DDE family transposase [Paraburkholderia sp. BL18I3N2]|nr:DDE family transposase [Paraburkholderia sp. BL18I3N2]PRX95905.1 DDE family transposase [Paraburkholderia sp. BL25I1N1]
MRLRHCLLATARRMAGSRRLDPTDRRKLGSKHHLIVDAQGIPLAVILSAANRHDITQLNALVEAIPHIRGKRGHPLHKPQIVQGDRGYSSEPHRQRLRERGITPVLANWLAPWKWSRQNALASRAFDCMASLVSTPENSLRTLCPYP